MKRYSFILTVLFMGAALFLIGCSAEPIKYTGGGTIDSAVEGKANIGFVLNNCKDPAHLRFIFQDKAAGVKMKGGEILEFTHDEKVKVSYTSMMKDSFGEYGEMKITLVDLGEANGDHGTIDIEVTYGPFDGYENLSAIISGNIQEHECDNECDYD